MTKKSDLIEEARRLKIDTTGMTVAEIEEAILTHDNNTRAAATGVTYENLPEPAESLPVEITTEPTKVEANEARFDNQHTEGGYIGDPERDNPGETTPEGAGNQDRDFTAASRAQDFSDPVAAQMVTNAEAGIFNEPPHVAEEKRRSSKYKEDHLAERGSGAGGPADSVG